MQTVAPERQPICSCVLQAKMTSLQGSIKLSAEAGREAQLCCIYRSALAPFDPAVRAKVIGKRVLFLLLGDSSITQRVSCKRGNMRFACQHIYRLVRPQLDGCLLTKSTQR